MSPFVVIIDSLKSFLKIFKVGDLNTRLSFFIMGFSNLVNKQIVKGLLYLVTQVAFLIFMIDSGFDCIQGLFTLGTQAQGWKFDEKRKINVLVDGDNSMLMLIYGVTVLLICGVFICIYLSNIKSANKIQFLKKNNKSIPTLKEEIEDLFDSKFHITLLAIPILGILIFTIMPLIFMILIAFTSFDSAHQPPGNLFSWIGLQNFFNMFFSGSKLGRSFLPILTWTFIWAIFATASNYILGIIVALMINKKGIRFKAMWRTIFVLTIAVPQFISLLTMRNMLHEYGPINQFLKDAGLITQSIPFLTDGTFAKISVLIVNIWIGVPYSMLITSGILMNIPKDMYESAKIDGASSIVIFFKITLPYILFVTAPHLITQFTLNLNNFNVIYLLTEGGPLSSDYYFAGKTDLLITWLYKLTAEQKDYNIASTIGICVFVISVVISLTTYRKTASYGKEDEFA